MQQIKKVTTYTCFKQLSQPFLLLVISGMPMNMIHGMEPEEHLKITYINGSMPQDKIKIIGTEPLWYEYASQSSNKKEYVALENETYTHDDWQYGALQAYNMGRTELALQWFNQNGAHATAFNKLATITSIKDKEEIKKIRTCFCHYLAGKAKYAELTRINKAIEAVRTDFEKWKLKDAWHTIDRYIPRDDEKYFIEEEIINSFKKALLITLDKQPGIQEKKEITQDILQILIGFASEKDSCLRFCSASDLLLFAGRAYSIGQKEWALQFFKIDSDNNTAFHDLEEMSTIGDQERKWSAGV